MQSVTRVGHVQFDHADDFKGEVTIIRGDVKMTVPIESLRHFVAESVRFQLAMHIQGMKPVDLLRRIA